MKGLAHQRCVVGKILAADVGCPRVMCQGGEAILGLHSGCPCVDLIQPLHHPGYQRLLCHSIASSFWCFKGSSETPVSQLVRCFFWVVKDACATARVSLSGALIILTRQWLPFMPRPCMHACLLPKMFLHASESKTLIYGLIEAYYSAFACLSCHYMPVVG